MSTNPKIGELPGRRQRPAERSGAGLWRSFWSGGGVEGDFAAEGLELADVGALAAFRAGAGVVAWLPLGNSVDARAVLRAGQRDHDHARRADRLRPQRASRKRGRRPDVHRPAGSRDTDRDRHQHARKTDRGRLHPPSQRSHTGQPDHLRRHRSGKRDADRDNHGPARKANQGRVARCDRDHPMTAPLSVQRKPVDQPSASPWALRGGSREQPRHARPTRTHGGRPQALAPGSNCRLTHVLARPHSPR
jgi:hypothetical protein